MDIISDLDRAGCRPYFQQKNPEQSKLFLLLLGKKPFDLVLSDSLRLTGTAFGTESRMQYEICLACNGRGLEPEGNPEPFSSFLPQSSLNVLNIILTGNCPLDPSYCYRLGHTFSSRWAESKFRNENGFGIRHGPDLFENILEHFLLLYRNSGAPGFSLRGFSFSFYLFAPARPILIYFLSSKRRRNVRPLVLQLRS